MIPMRASPRTLSATTVSGASTRCSCSLLMRHGFKSKWWATFRQWDQLGGKVMRRPDDVPAGEWGTAIIFWKPLEVTEKDENGKERTKTIFMMRTYMVFNVDQVRGHLDHLRVGHNTTNTAPIVTYEEADRAIEATGADIRYGGNSAFYHRKGDYIQVPMREQFAAPEYYETMLHELCHWSQHPNRLDWHQAERALCDGRTHRRDGKLLPGHGTGHSQRRNVAEPRQLPGALAAGNEERPPLHFSSRSQASKAADFILSFSRIEAPEHGRGFGGVILPCWWGGGS